MTDARTEDVSDGIVDERALTDSALAQGMRADADDATNTMAWREFYRRHLPHVKGFIEARARDSGLDVCDDLLSKSVERIQKGIGGFVDHGPGKLRSWCIRIADRVVQDLWRGRLRDLRDGPPGATDLVSFDEIEERYGSGLVAGDEADYTAIALRAGEDDPPFVSKNAGMLCEAFDSLNDVDRVVIWYSFILKESDAQIAHITGKPLDHVRKIRFKAVNKLRKRFDRLLEQRRLAS